MVSDKNKNPVTEPVMKSKIIAAAVLNPIINLQISVTANNPVNPGCPVNADPMDYPPHPNLPANVNNPANPGYPVNSVRY